MNRHVWRCKSKFTQQSANNDHVTNSNDNISHNIVEVVNINNANVSNNEFIKCTCGKECKGLRGLKAHQRSCRTIRSLCSEVYDDISDNNSTIVNDVDEIDHGIPESPDLKPGIKLPTTAADWETANMYFHTNLPVGDVNATNIEEIIINFNEKVYTYFADNHGTVNKNKEMEKEFINIYKDFSKHKLKKELKRLKSTENVPVLQIRYVSKLLRHKSNLKTTDQVYSIDHDMELKNNFWSYVKHYVEKPKRILSSFDNSKCYTFFKKSFSCIQPCRIFRIPSWIPKFTEPTTPFNLKPPSYVEICKVVNRMKSSGSPCPLDQISIICYKRCPYLRTYLTEIIGVVWKNKTVPSSWKKAISILIYKKRYQFTGKFSTNYP